MKLLVFKTGPPKQKPAHTRGFCFEHSVLAPTYSRLSTTIGAGGLNYRVRNENGCDPTAEAPARNAQSIPFVNPPAGGEERHAFVLTDSGETKHKRIKRKRSRDSHNSFREFCRIISTPWLNALLHFHRAPINVVISHDPITIPYLGVGFPLGCFQRLSVPDIATGRCTWRYSPQTRGQFISVLSY